MASLGLRVAVLGATGAVGAEILQVLDERRFPVRELLAYASPDSEGDELEFRDHSVKLRRARVDEIAACDLVLSAAPGALPPFLPALRRGQARVIDVTGALEADPEVPLWLPGVAPFPSEPRPRFVAVPRGVTGDRARVRARPPPRTCCGESLRSRSSPRRAAASPASASSPITRCRC
jgi:aspartate-semialdehyde dehydrogenase